MNLKTAIQKCLSRKGAMETYPFGPEPAVIKVKSKMFAIVSEKGAFVSLSLKCDPVLVQGLREAYSSIKPGYHLNKEHWNTITLDGTVPESEICWMIDLSYELVVKNLTKKEKEELMVS